MVHVINNCLLNQSTFLPNTDNNNPGNATYPAFLKHILRSSSAITDICSTLQGIVYQINEPDLSSLITFYRKETEYLTLLNHNFSFIFFLSQNDSTRGGGISQSLISHTNKNRPEMKAWSRTGEWSIMSSAPGSCLLHPCQCATIWIACITELSWRDNAGPSPSSTETTALMAFLNHQQVHKE